jgi:RND family efflux transporter MFP subunit
MTLIKLRKFAAIYAPTLLLLLAGILTGCSGEKEEILKPVVRPAKLITIEPADDVRTLSLPAVIEAGESVDLTFKVGGLVEELPVTMGVRIEEGDLVARLDQTELRNQLTKATAEFENAESEFQRAERLIAGDAMSQSDFEARKSRRDVAKTARDDAQKRLDDSSILSPFSGVISDVYAKQFQNVGANEKIATLQTTGEGVAVVQVPATLVANAQRLEPQQTTLTLDIRRNTKIEAKLDSFNTEADPQSQTFRAEFKFTPPDDVNVLPGMTGTLESRFKIIKKDGTSERIMVPVGAIQSEDDKKYIWVVDEATMTVSQREVTVSLGDADEFAVTSGLEAGDVIVGAGASYLHEGMEVRPYQQ